MRIALLSHLASPAAPTGAEHSLTLLAAGLAERGHEVGVAAPGPWALGDRLRAAGVEVETLPLRMCWLVQYEEQPMWRQLARALRFAWPDAGAARLQRWLRTQRPDVVHVNCLPHLRGAEIAGSLGIPVVWHLREMLPPGPRRRWFARRLRRDATRIVAVSEAVAGWLREEGLDGLVEVVHNGVEAPARLMDAAGARARFGLPEDAVAIGLFSQLVAHKGALDLVRAAAAAGPPADRAHYLIAGHGPSAFVGRLRREIAARGLADRVHLVPPQDGVWELVAAVDILAVTTLWPDPLPRVVMEAMAAGRPVVAYDGGGVPEMVVDGTTGLLVRTGHPEALAAAIVRLAGSRDLRQSMGAAGRERADREFSVDRHVARMEAVLAAAARRRES